MKTDGFLLKNGRLFCNSRYCSDCDLDDVRYDTVHHGVEHGDNFMEGTLDTTYISSFGKGTATLVSNTNTSMATEEGEGQVGFHSIFLCFPSIFLCFPFILLFSLHFTPLELHLCSVLLGLYEFSPVLLCVAWSFTGYRHCSRFRRDRAAQDCTASPVAQPRKPRI